jgi:cell division protein FtsL
MKGGWVVALGGVVAISAMALVFARHEGRRQFAELQLLQQERDRLQIEWGRLQLEQSTWTTHGRIDRMARDRLALRLPTAAEVVLIDP